MEEGNEIPKILWCITSSGDMLRDVINLMVEIASWNAWDIDVAMTRETPFVLNYYNAWFLLREHFTTIFQEKGANAPFLGGPIQRNKYKFILVAPVTGNTMAKIARGIADALVPNCVALGLKARVPVYLFPTDQEGIGEETVLADGSILHLYPRAIDLENVRRASEMDHVTVFKNLNGLRSFFMQKREDGSKR
ncbi:MAG: flavoprotein [Promethearchaeota archaeon]